MPGRAFIPGPLAQAQPRVYKALRGRQLKGLLLAGAGAVLGLVLFGFRDAAGFGATFLLSVPGFAYGYFQPEGKPVEYWLLVQIRYHWTTQRFGSVPPHSWWRRRMATGWRVLQAMRRARRMKKHKEVLQRG